MTLLFLGTLELVNHPWVLCLLFIVVMLCVNEKLTQSYFLIFLNSFVIKLNSSVTY